MSKVVAIPQLGPVVITATGPGMFQAEGTAVGDWRTPWAVDFVVVTDARGTQHVSIGNTTYNIEEGSKEFRMIAEGLRGALKPPPVRKNAGITIYIVGGGTVWRLDAAAQRAVAGGADWSTVAVQTAARQHWNARKGANGAWRGLPRALYAQDANELAPVNSANCEVLNYDWPMEIVAACRRNTR